MEDHDKGISKFHRLSLPHIQILDLLDALYELSNEGVVGWQSPAVKHYWKFAEPLYLLPEDTRVRSSTMVEE